MVGGARPRRDRGLGRAAARASATRTASGPAGRSCRPGFTREAWQAEGQPWTATCFALSQLREFGLDPRLGERPGARWRWSARTPAGTRAASRSGRARSRSASTAAPSPTAPSSASTSAPIVERLLGERQPDGGWNCERANGSTRSSFDTTINVLEGLLEYERATGGTPAVRAARRSGEAFLLERALFRRLSTGEPADPDFLLLWHPNRWRHDILRGLDHFRAASLADGEPPDPRLGEAIAEIRRRRLPDGRWPLDRTPRGRVWFAVDEPAGQPSRWVTLRALRVLEWWESARAG